eukprot:249521_1
MSLGWLSEPAVLPSQSKEICIDQSSTRELAEAVFNKETEARQYGAIITNRQKITTLRNQQKQFISNQNAAKRDEFIRQQNQFKNQQRIQTKINKYESIMKGDSNTVSNEYLVNFEAKGIDIITEKHNMTLLKQRNNNKNKIDYDLYEDMVINPNDKPQNKITFENKMETYLSHRKQLIIDARNRKNDFIKQIKSSNIESFIYEMNKTETQKKTQSRIKPIFTNKIKTRIKSVNNYKSSVHKNIAMEIKNKKRKLNDINANNKLENDNNNNEQPLKKMKSKRIDKDCDYATIPPPDNLYGNKRNEKQNIEVDTPVTMQQSPMGQGYQYGYQYNPYLHGYNPYMNVMNPYQMQYQYPYYNPYQANAFSNVNTN